MLIVRPARFWKRFSIHVVLRTSVSLIGVKTKRNAISGAASNCTTRMLLAVA